MVKNLLRSVLLLLPIVAFLSCEEEISSPIVILIGQDQYGQNVNSGEYAFFDIEVIAQSELESVTIQSKRTTVGIEELYSETVEGLSYKYAYQYLAPTINAESEAVSFIISASDSVGNSQSITVSLTIIGGDVLLSEISGQTLYGANSGNVNGYSIALDQWVYVDNVALSSDSDEVADEADEDDLVVEAVADFYDYSDDPESESLQCQWRSATSKYFAKLTGFDYGSATAASVIAGYAVAEKLDRVINIAIDDVIFIGQDGTTPLAVVKVNAIFDEQGSAQDRYNISLKILK